MSESQLVEAIKNNDQQAFKSLVDKYQEIVLNTCYNLVNDEDEAKDLTQEVFIEIYNSIQKFRGDAKLSTWIYRIAINKSLNFIRAAKRKRLISSIDAMFKTSNVGYLKSDKSFDADHIIIESEISKALYGAIEGLSKSQRIAFSLHKLEDVSYNQIAEIMDLSLPAVESLIHRAKLNLQKKLINYYKK